ncbi:MAG TPA: hypothetical protein VH684_09350 [Xanthobacteraceae bacterium]|jgi:hypothetical protein
MLQYLHRLSALKNDNPVLEEWRAEAEAAPEPGHRAGVKSAVTGGVPK